MKSALIGVIAVLLAPLTIGGAAYAKAADKPAAAAAKPAAAKDDRNYDCSKAGNANKTACKDAKPAAAKPTIKAAPAKAATPAAKAMPATPAKAATPATKAMPATPAKAATPAAKAAPAPVAAVKDERNYDCTKAGNANKTVCKEAAKDERNYDCSKAGNANKTACKGVVQAKAAAPASKSITPPPAPKVVASTAKGAGIGPRPAGATAQCADGSYSSSQTRQGTCSTHGGVAKWF